LTYYESTRTQWQKVFYISTAIYCFGAIVFVVFGSAELQDWAGVPQIAADEFPMKIIQDNNDKDVGLEEE